MTKLRSVGCLADKLECDGRGTDAGRMPIETRAIPVTASLVQGPEFSNFY